VFAGGDVRAEDGGKKPVVAGASEFDKKGFCVRRRHYFN